MSSLRWYILQAHTGYEKRVQKYLQERIELAGLADHFGRILVPTEEVVELRSGQKRKSERKIYPSYVFVEMEMNDETWHLVRHIPHVSGFVGGTKTHPAPISDKEAQDILQQIETGSEQPRHKTLFDVGEVVRVTDGPFSDFNGVVEEVNYDKSRVVVSVSIFGRSTPVELGFNQVQKESV